MEKFQCYECGIKSVTQKDIVFHMNKHHGIKVEIESVMKTIFCGSCSFISMNMNEFKKHMIEEHNKEEYNWWSDEIKAEYYCNQCDSEFNNKAIFTDHIEMAHIDQTDKFEAKTKMSRGTKRDINEIDRVENIIETPSSDFIRETYPYNEEDETEKEFDGITFKGKSRKYIVAYNKLRSKMIQGTEFKVKENKLKIKATPKNKPMKVELTNDKGEKGMAQIQMYNPEKKGATVLITKSSGEDFETVRTIADVFIEKFLSILLKGLITGEEEIMEYIMEPTDVKNPECFMCEKCEKGFTTNHGLKIHNAWHTKNANKEEGQMPNDISFIPKTIQNSTCEWCGETFKAELKYQALNTLLMHKKICSNKPLVKPIIQIIRKCSICDYEGKNEKRFKKSHER